MLGARALSTAAAAQSVVDVAIVGGGMTGAALAAALGEACWLCAQLQHSVWLHCSIRQSKRKSPAGASKADMPCRVERFLPAAGISALTAASLSLPTLLPLHAPACSRQPADQALESGTTGQAASCKHASHH